MSGFKGETFLNNPHAVCDYSVTEESREESVLEVVRRVVPSWSAALLEDVNIRALQGGITNTMYLLTWEKEDLNIIVRLFGANTELLIDRKNENGLFAALSRLDMGCPTFYGLFKNGRVEGYLPARSVRSAEMRESYVYLRVAEVAARFHTRGSTIDAAAFPHHNRMHPQFAEYFALCSDLFRDASADMKSKFETVELPAISAEMTWLTPWLLSQAAAANAAPLNLPLTCMGPESKAIAVIPREMLGDAANHRSMARYLAFEEVLCHYDMLCGNILIDLALDTQVLAGNDKNYVGGVTLIDYEYSAFTYRAFDLANFFCEFAGFDRSIEETYPGQDIRRAVIRAYFDACAAEYEAFRSGWDGERSSRERLIWLYWQGLRGDPSVEARAAAECIVEEFERCVNQLTLCAHLLWYLWGIVQSTVSTVDFDYIEYVRVRLAGFRYHKSCFHPDAPSPADITE